jgi:hypothetical protein
MKENCPNYVKVAIGGCSVLEVKMEPYRAVVLHYFDLDADGKIGKEEQPKLQKYETLMRAGEASVADMTPEKRVILADMWLAHVLTENLKLQDARLAELDCFD